MLLLAYIPAFESRWHCFILKLKSHNLDKAFFLHANLECKIYVVGHLNGYGYDSALYY